MNIIICDTDKAKRSYCKERILQVSAENKIPVTVSSQETGEQVLFNVAENGETAIVYIDVSLVDMDGIKFAEKLRKEQEDIDIVFFTEDKSRVFEAFDVDALHYLVKNEISTDKFDEVFLKAINRARRNLDEKMIFSCAGEYRRVSVADIKYFEVMNRIITVHYNDESFEFYSTISKIEEALFNRGFHRTHRSFLVAEKYIETASKNEVKLIDGTVIPVGRHYWNAIKELSERRYNNE